MKSCLFTDERYLEATAADEAGVDAHGNFILPEYLGNLPDKMDVKSKKIKLKLKDGNESFNIVRTGSGDECPCPVPDCQIPQPLFSYSGDKARKQMSMEEYSSITHQRQPNWPGQSATMDSTLNQGTIQPATISPVGSPMGSREYHMASE